MWPQQALRAMMTTILDFLRDSAGVLIGLIMIVALCYVAIMDEDSAHRRKLRRWKRRLGGDVP